MTSHEPTQPTRQNRPTTLIQVRQPPHQAGQRERRARPQRKSQESAANRRQAPGPGGGARLGPEEGNDRSEDMDEVLLEASNEFNASVAGESASRDRDAADGRLDSASAPDDSGSRGRATGPPRIGSRPSRHRGSRRGVACEPERRRPRAATGPVDRPASGLGWLPPAAAPAAGREPSVATLRRPGCSSLSRTIRRNSSSSVVVG